MITYLWVEKLWISRISCSFERKIRIRCFQSMGWYSGVSECPALFIYEQRPIKVWSSQHVFMGCNYRQLHLSLSVSNISPTAMSCHFLVKKKNLYGRLFRWSLYKQTGMDMEDINISMYSYLRNVKVNIVSAETFFIHVISKHAVLSWRFVWFTLFLKYGNLHGFASIDLRTCSYTIWTKVLWRVTITPTGNLMTLHSNT